MTVRLQNTSVLAPVLPDLGVASILVSGLPHNEPALAASLGG